MYRIYTEKTVDEAVAKGLNELGVTEDDIKIEVTDSGSSGFLGFGKRDAEVKLTVINPELKTYGSIEALIEEKNQAASQKTATEDITSETEEAVQPEIPEEDVPEEESVEISVDEVRTDDEEMINESPFNSAAEETAQYVSRIVHEMNIPNETVTSIKDNQVTIEFHAELAAKIIGKRGQTLNALQELAQNYFNTIYKSYGSVFLDVENYRAKRRETLENLAVNMSKKALRTEEPVKMEPMPSFERKIMHHVLSRMKDIETYSEGREPNRRVVIIKK